MRQVRPEEAVTITRSEQRGLAEEGLHAKALVDEEPAIGGPRASIHEHVLGKEDHLYLRKASIEDGQDERKDHDLTGLLIEGATSVGLGPRVSDAWRATCDQDEGQLGEPR